MLGADSFCYILFHLPLVGWPSSGILHVDQPYKSHDCQGEDAFCLMFVLAVCIWVTIIWQQLPAWP